MVPTNTMRKTTLIKNDLQSDVLSKKIRGTLTKSLRVTARCMWERKADQSIQ